MLRVLKRKGLNIEDVCQQRDANMTGFLLKNKFAEILRNIGLPFSAKDLNEIILRYTVPPQYDIIDYNSFLLDSGVKSKYAKTDSDFSRDIDGSIQSDLSMFTRVFVDVKRMLVETVKGLGRQIDDIYRMFAKWDNDGSGTITSIQFLRVLVRLHVDLPDQDQDSLVDLLDTTSMGRIDFESLLDFCFSGLSCSGSLSVAPLIKSTAYTGSNDDNLSFQDGKYSINIICNVTALK